MRAFTRICLIPPLLAAVSGAPAELDGQTAARWTWPPPATANGSPLTAWSPLSPIADQPRRLPLTPGPPRILGEPDPEVGLFWTAGNPAALPLDVDERYNRLALAAAQLDGAFRRPLDPRQVDGAHVQARGFQPLGDAAAAAGAIAVGQEAATRLPFADIVDPYASNPHVLADSSFPRMRRVYARAEGAFGRRLAGWSLGLAAGAALADQNTRDARFPRIGRLSEWGGTIGATRRLPIAGAVLASGARYSAANESMRLLAEPGLGVVYRIHGYGEPIRGEVQPPANTFFRRMERRAWSWGAAAAWTVLDLDWVVSFDKSRRDDGYFSELRADPPKDRWEADGWALTGAAQRSFVNGRLRVTAVGSHSRLTGDAGRADVDGTIFRARETATDFELDVRYSTPGSRWLFALAASLAREARERTDFLTRVTTEIKSWMPGAAMTAAWRPRPSTAVSLGYAISFYSSTSAIPRPSALGPLYRLLTGPELAVYATEIRPNGLELSAEQSIGPGRALLLRIARRATGSGDRVAPLAPTGDRTQWEGSLSLILR